MHFLRCDSGLRRPHQALHRLRKAIQALKEGNDTSSRAKNVGPRVMGALTALRQACCHPNISGGQGRIKASRCAHVTGVFPVGAD